MPNSASSDFSGEDALQHRIEFRALGELVLLDDLAGEIARQHQLHLAGDGLGVERGALLVALAVRPQEHVLAPVDQDARFGLVARRDHIDRGERYHQRQHRRNDDPAPLAHQRLAERMQIEIAGLRMRPTGFGAEGAGLGHRPAAPPALSLPARQNAKRIAHSRGRKLLPPRTRADYTPLWLPLG